MFIPSISLHLLFFTKMSSTGWFARVPHIRVRRRPSSTSNTNHGVGEPFVQLNFLDALAAHWKLTNEYLCSLEPDSGLGVRLTNCHIQVDVSHPSPSHKQECPGRNQGEYR